ncbi:Ribonuclease, Rne/Rng family [Rubellimicrobium mesophilum DSM 19309]|uniref:Ribonuclease, Rne/Rng family n=1 Tax=Rubellimicrobium mesophilum DSM 19309 TaxID=442562 RepID=A0A017HP49_9RHOB|nr:ribonuclease E/G [Rubellimicrobium mesophilum]EYD76060.1 Ribonuclease, Rne/Rng family [Rubellimicrobium mesophilum DSM 19309]
MKGRTIVLDHLHGREAAALLVDGKLDDLLIDDDSAPRPGTVYRAVTDRGLKGQGGMMLRIPGGTAWMRNASGLRSGEPMLVQVTGVAEGGKAVPVTDRILFKSRYAIVTPGAPGINVSRQIRDEEERGRLLAIAEDVFDAEHGLILRSNCEGADEDEVAEDIAAMRDLAEKVMVDASGDPEMLAEGDGPHLLAWREWSAPTVVTKPGGFAREGVLEQIDALRQPEVALGEGSMVVETTRALVAVDVNTGGDTTPTAALKANLAAARALPRQLRLRGLGGQVVVDFANMSKGHRKQLEQSLRDSFRSDPIETSLVGWTAMGLFELSRKRERLPLAHLLGEG